MMCRRSGFVLTLWMALVLGSPRTDAQVGTVLDEHKISALEGGFAVDLEEDAYFGACIASLGDLNGDGTSDLAVSAYGQGAAGANGGTIWILFLDPHGQVLRQTVIPGLTVYYSQSLAGLGDLDGDGVGELAVGHKDPDHRVDLFFLRADGTVKSRAEVEAADPVFVPAINGDFDDGFGEGLAGPGDLDGDGVPDMVIGAPFDDDGPGLDNGALWIVYLERDGRTKAAHKLSERFGGGAGLLDTEDLGLSVLSLGDLDADGNLDLLVGDQRRGVDSLLVLFLDKDEHLRTARRISQQEFGLVDDGVGREFDFFFGQALALLGDVDGDGTTEFAVGASQWTPSLDTPPGFTPRLGAILVGSLRRDGALARSVLISAQRGGFAGVLSESTEFGHTLAALGDLDGDGANDLAVGASHSDEAEEDDGAVWILELDGSAVRNGSGRNPLSLQQASEPTLGRHWKVALDCGGHAAGLAYLAGFGASHPGLMTSAGELLVEVFASPRLFQSAALHDGAQMSFLVPLPRDASLIGRALYVQGLCSGAPGPQLSNALDVIIGR